MTVPDPETYLDDDDVDAADAPAQPATTFEVFNPDGTVGVACNRDGDIVGIHLTDEARENGDTWLGNEIVRVARLAYTKSRMGLRQEMEARGTRPHTIDSFDLPTPAAYRALEETEFGSSAR